MAIVKPVILTLLTFAAIALAPDFPANAAASASQTMINPAAPRKSPYPKVVIYTVSWCPHCKELKEYLTSRNIPFINRDVELEAAAMEDLTQKYKSFGVPVVVIGNDQELLKGFTGEQFEKLVDKVRSGNK